MDKRYIKNRHRRFPAFTPLEKTIDPAIRRDEANGGELSSKLPLCNTPVRGCRWLSLTGFTFIEVMVTVAILSFGLVTICESFLSSVNAYNYCSNMLNVQGWMNEKIWEMQDTLIRLKALDVDAVPSGRFFIGNKKITWRMNINFIEGEDDLYKVDLTLNWQEGSRSINVSRSVYAAEYTRIKSHKN